MKQILIMQYVEHINMFLEFVNKYVVPLINTDDNILSKQIRKCINCNNRITVILI